MNEYYGMYPENDYRYYLMHYAKGEEADDHKYIKKTTTKNGKIRYIYSEDNTADYKSPLGRYGKGNIDLYDRPIFRNEDGSISTVESFSTNIDGKEVLLPTIEKDAKGRAVRVSEDQAIQKYLKTGKHLGKFDTPEEATKYAIKLHDEQDKIYSKRASSTSDEPKVLRPKNVGRYKTNKNAYLKVKNKVI